MRYEEKTKDKLIKEMQEMQKKITELEKVKVDYNQLEEKLKQSYKKLQKIIIILRNICNSHETPRNILCALRDNLN